MTGHFIVTPEQEQQVLELYQVTQYIGEIAKQVGLDRHAVSQVLRESPSSGYDPATSRRHTYFYDERYFQQIDNEAKAYFFGLLASDGWLKYENNRSCAVCISLHEKDVNILRRFSETLGQQAPLPKYKARKQQYRLEFHSVQMCRDLEGKGFGRDKTFSLGDIAQYVPPEHHRHFVRGVFDGDGGWIIEPYRLRFSFRGTEEFLFSLQAILPVRSRVNGRGTWKSLSNTRHRDAELLGIWMYEDTNLFLERKYVKFISGIER